MRVPDDEVGAWKNLRPDEDFEAVVKEIFGIKAEGLSPEARAKLKRLWDQARASLPPPAREPSIAEATRMFREASGCEFCHGSGKAGGGHITCPRCHGTGIREVSR